MKRRFFTLLLPFSLLLTACSTYDLDDGQYWERSNSSDMAYVTGPKAQQMLNRDIARCVTELRELERLGQIKNPIPVDSGGRVLDPDERKMAKHDVTDRDGYLLAEHQNYQDFESCMYAGGWRRTQYVPYDVADRAKKNHLQVLADGIKGIFTDEEEDKSLNPYEDYEVNN